MTPLTACKHLRKLFLQDTSIESLQPFMEMPSLKRCVLANCYNCDEDEIEALKAHLEEKVGSLILLEKP